MNRTGHKGCVEKLTPKRVAFYGRHRMGLEEMIGRRFGLWTVGAILDRNKWGQRLAAVVCDCGTRSTVTVKHLRNGDSSSCGCWKRQTTIERSTKHKACGSLEYNAWAAMKQRCLNSKTYGYPWYGALGVTICQEWINDFSAFLRDIGPKPSPSHTLDRINPFGNYEPANCRWATWLEQARNKRKSRE